MSTQTLADTGSSAPTGGQLCAAIALPIVGSTHFYGVHRLLHWPPLYRKVHALHHRTINIGPWSGVSMHPVESVL